MSAGAAVEAGARPLRVLLVEDDLDDAALLARHLRRAGFSVEMRRVETADTMRDALHSPWDCILADYNLPRFSAPEALQLLQSVGQDIPFIMMSGAVSEATAVEAMRAGAHDYVSKENLTRLVPAIEREIAEAASRKLKRATEVALRSSQERFRLLLEATPLALLISDMQGRVSYANGGAQQLLALSREDVEGGRVNLAGILDSDGLDEESGNEGQHVASSLLRRLTATPNVTWETVCRRSDSTAIPTLVAAAVLSTELADDTSNLAVFFVDLRDQKRNEAVLRRTEKLVAAGRLAASIAHEINNPLEAVTNCLFLLEQHPLPEPQNTYLAMARSELDRVTHITTQTLRFYRQSSHPVVKNIAQLLDSVLSLYDARLRNKSIQVEHDYASAPSIIALEGEIRQILANLVGNSIDALQSREGPRRLALRAHPAWLNGGTTPGVAIVVADTGCGMSPEVRAHLFEPFFSTKGITGTGLGLWVSHGIIAKHNGKVQVRSRAGAGTVFRILLPLSSTIVDNGAESLAPVLS